MYNIFIYIYIVYMHVFKYLYIQEDSSSALSKGVTTRKTLHVGLHLPLKRLAEDSQSPSKMLNSSRFADREAPCNALQRTATHLTTLRCTATHCNALRHKTTHRNTLQRSVLYCTTLQHTVTHCNELQHGDTLQLRLIRASCGTRADSSTKTISM